MANQSRLRDESEKQAPASWKKFFVILTGRTNGAHQSVVRIFKSSGQTETTSPEDADYCLVFCPVSSRVGTDVDEAVEHLPADKAAVLVVMHHTFDPEQMIPPSRRVVKDQRVRLTLDCLFYQNHLLSCQFNRRMEAQIKKFFRHPELMVFWLLSWFRRNCCKLIVPPLVGVGILAPGVWLIQHQREKISAHPLVFGFHFWSISSWFCWMPRVSWMPCVSYGFMDWLREFLHCLLIPTPSPLIGYELVMIM